MMLLARSQAGVQLPQGRPVSLWGEPSKGRGRGQGEVGEKTAVPVQNRQGKGAGTLLAEA